MSLPVISDGNSSQSVGNIHTLLDANAPSQNESRREEINKYVAVAIMGFIIVLGSIGNTTVILAVKNSKKLQTISNIFIINLSICDLLYVTCVLPFNIYTNLVDGWYLNAYLCRFVGLLGYTLSGTTIITITLIAWNRFKLVENLSTYKRIFTHKNIALMLVMAWIIPLFSTLPALLEIWGKFGYVAILVTCNLLLSHESQSFKLFLLVVRAGIPSCLIIYYYMKIYLMSRASHYRVQATMRWQLNFKRHYQQKEMHLTRMMAVIFVIFILSYFPCTITGIIDWNKILSKNFHRFCSITVYIGSATNPLIYGLMNSQFRNAYFQLLPCQTTISRKLNIRQASNTVTKNQIKQQYPVCLLHHKQAYSNLDAELQLDADLLLPTSALKSEPGILEIDNTGLYTTTNL